jgi:hypothetical protein
MEAPLIPAPADCEVRSVTKFLNALQKLRRAIHNKRRGMLSAGTVFLHDNARPHKARRTASLLQEFSSEVFNHPPYSPTLAVSVAINISQKLCFVSVNGPRETYFVDEMYRFVTMVYYNYHNSVHYPSSCRLLKLNSTL